MVIPQNQIMNQEVKKKSWLTKVVQREIGNQCQSIKMETKKLATKKHLSLAIVSKADMFYVAYSQ